MKQEAQINGDDQAVNSSVIQLKPEHQNSSGSQQVKKIYTKSAGTSKTQKSSTGPKRAGSARPANEKTGNQLISQGKDPKATPTVSKKGVRGYSPMVKTNGGLMNMKQQNSQANSGQVSTKNSKGPGQKQTSSRGGQGDSGSMASQIK
jgi:hypothetical protein